MVNALAATFAKDWAATGYDEAQAEATAGGSPPVKKSKAIKVLVKEMPPLRTTLKKAIKQAVRRAGKQALAISRNAQVRAFAEQMVKDHTAVNDQALALVKKLKVTPEDNATSKGLTTQAAAKRAELARLSGAAFDKAYIANEIAFHKTVNSALETALIPSAQNAELKSLLQTGLKLFQGHQQHAEHVGSATN